jgi:DNA repair protein SbcD/Mre11
VRFIHTSDWHLGRSFHQVGLLDAQAAFVDHLVETVRAESVDAVLVSGDVYDRALPAPDTVTLLSEAVTRLIDAGTQVVLSSGNHDSAIRLGFASSLLERAGLHIRSSLADVGRPVVVDGAAVYPLPYLEPSVAADPLGAAERTHAGVLTAAMARVRADRKARGLPSIVMSHAFVNGGATSDSERDITVGGVAMVHPRVFDGTGYVALGHLHGRQRITDTVRYSGSPVAMSFSEATHTKGSWLVDLDTAGVRVQQVEAPVLRPLAVLRGDLSHLLEHAAYAEAERSWCQVTLTDPVRPLGAMEKIRRRFPHTLSLLFDPQGAPVPVSSYAARLAQKSDVDVCCDFLSHVRSGQAAEPAEREVLAEAVEAVRLRRAGRDDEGSVSAASTGVAERRGVA